MLSLPVANPFFQPPTYDVEQEEAITELQRVFCRMQVADKAFDYFLKKDLFAILFLSTSSSVSKDELQEILLRAGWKFGDQADFHLVVTRLFQLLFNYSQVSSAFMFVFHFYFIEHVSARPAKCIITGS